MLIKLLGPIVGWMVIILMVTTPVWLLALIVGYFLSWRELRPAASARVCALATVTLTGPSLLGWLLLGGSSVFDSATWYAVWGLWLWTFIPIGAVAFWAGWQRAEIMQRGPWIFR